MNGPEPVLRLDGGVPAVPGTNADIESTWTTAVVGDGRFHQAGVYAPDGSKVVDRAILTMPETRQIAVVVPRSALGAVDLATASYAVAMLGNAEGGEDIGFVGRSTTTTTGTTLRPTSPGSRSSASAAAPARSISCCPARTPTHATPTRSA